MAKKRINAQDLVSKIEKITRARMASQDVVALNDFRDFKNKIDPKIILVIEDDETMRAAIKKIFETEGYLVKLAPDGTELSEALQTYAPDIILLDIGLPWLNGIELGQMLKEHKDLKKIPLIFISGKATEDEIKQAFDIGADDFIRKPFDIDKLKKTVATLLKIKP